MLMTNDLMLGGVYIVMAIMLVLGSLMARREPAAKMVTMALTWILIFAAGFVLFTFRDDFGWVAERLKAEAVGTPVEQGKETRIPMAIDGHFWVNAKLNGKDVKFLVDSGATLTTVDRDTAITAMILADIAGTGDIRPDHRLWPAVESWSAEVGLTGPDAISHASQLALPDASRQQEPAIAQPDLEAGQ